MQCEVCCGSLMPGMVITEIGIVSCPNGCMGGIASCCDAAGSAQPEGRCAPSRSEGSVKPDHRGIPNELQLGSPRKMREGRV